MKRETLKLFETFLNKAKALPEFRKDLVLPMMGLIITDYNDNNPDAREPEVLSLLTTIITKYKYVT